MKRGPWTVVAGRLDEWRSQRFTLNLESDPIHNYTESECVDLATVLLQHADTMKRERLARKKKK